MPPAVRSCFLNPGIPYTVIILVKFSVVSLIPEYFCGSLKTDYQTGSTLGVFFSMSNWVVKKQQKNGCCGSDQGLALAQMACARRCNPRHADTFTSIVHRSRNKGPALPGGPAPPRRCDTAQVPGLDGSIALSGPLAEDTIKLFISICCPNCSARCQ